MKLIWKRTIENKKVNFEADFILSVKINHDSINLPRESIEQEYLIESIQSVLEEHYFEMLKRQKERIKNNNSGDEKSKVRNHFRNVCFRKKFNTLGEHVSYIARYYGLKDLQVLSYVEEDLPIIKKQSGLK